MVMVITLVVTLIILPVEMSFYSDDFSSEVWTAINLICDFIFLFDIFINFRTGYTEHATENVSIQRCMSYKCLHQFDNFNFYYLHKFITHKLMRKWIIGKNICVSVSGL